MARLFSRGGVGIAEQKGGPELGCPGIPLPIRSWTKGDRPEGETESPGAAGLSVRELLAILLGSGGRLRLGPGRGGSAPTQLGGDGRDPAGSKGPGGPRVRTRMPPAPFVVSPPSLLGLLEAQPGIGSATAARIVAAMELGRRAAVDLGRGADQSEARAMSSPGWGPSSGI